MSSLDNPENNSLSEKDARGKGKELSVNTSTSNSNSDQDQDPEDNIKIESESDLICKKEPYIGTLEDVKEFHEYNADNAYILRGYRIHFSTFGRVMKSLIMVHNETFNIWSHLVGCLIALFLLILTMCSLTKLELLHYFSKFTGFIVINFSNENTFENYPGVNDISNFLNTTQHNATGMNLNKVNNETSLSPNSSFYNVSHDLYSLENLTLKRSFTSISKSKEIEMLFDSINELTKETIKPPSSNDLIFAKYEVLEKLVDENKLLGILDSM